MASGRAVRRRRNGTYHVQLPTEERAVLRRAATELLDSLEDADNVGVQRLFPAAHRDDPVGDAEFHLRRHDDLMAGRRAALATFLETADDEQLGEDQLQCWLTSLNDLRLVLGTQLDVTEDMNDIVPPDPRAPRYALYVYLGAVVEMLVDAAFGAIGRRR